MELLRTGDMQGLEALITERPGVVRHLLGRLWDEDPSVRSRTAAAVAIAAAHHQELGLELMRRFVWALNDESATNGVSVIPAMAAIAIQAPDLAGPFIGQLVGALHDPSLVEEANTALKLIRRRQPDLVERYVDEIEREKNQRLRQGGQDCPFSSDDANEEEPWIEN